MGFMVRMCLASSGWRGVWTPTGILASPCAGCLVIFTPKFDGFEPIPVGIDWQVRHIDETES